MIYLDNAATTKMFEKVAGVMKDYSCDAFYNPSAGYRDAVKISQKLNSARKELMLKLGASTGDVIFTSGATESNNLAIRGTVRNGKWEYIFSAGEHPSVFNTAKYLQEQGYLVKFIPLQKNGQIDYEELEKALNEKTRLISVIHVSNETGAINDLARINGLRKKICPKALFHADGVQAFCKIPVNLDELGVDLYTISAHKFHGPKGVGALYVRNKNGVKNIVFGGGQEGGLRSGTENVAGIMGMLYACGCIDVKENYLKACHLKKVFLDTLQNAQGVEVLDADSPYVISLTFAGVNGETLMRSVEEELIIGMGSACSAKYSGNRILNALGYPADKIKSSVRVSFNAYQSEEEVKRAGEILICAYNKLLEKVG